MVHTFSPTEQRDIFGCSPSVLNSHYILKLVTQKEKSAEVVCPLSCNANAHKKNGAGRDATDLFFAFLLTGLSMQ